MALDEKSKTKTQTKF